jgi:hypothetical protein
MSLCAWDLNSVTTGLKKYIYSLSKRNTTPSSCMGGGKGMDPLFLNFAIDGNERSAYALSASPPWIQPQENISQEARFFRDPFCKLWRSENVLKNGVFWDVTPCGSCKNRRFGGT